MVQIYPQPWREGRSDDEMTEAGKGRGVGRSEKSGFDGRDETIYTSNWNNKNGLHLIVKTQKHQI